MGAEEKQAAIEPKNSEYQARTLRFAEAHTFAQHLGIEMTKCEPGRVELEMEPTSFHKTTRQYIHTGVVLAMGELAATLATLTLLGADEHGEHLELKVDFVRQPRGERLIARGRVVDAGRRLTAGEAEIFVAMGAREALVAKLSTLQQVAPGVE